MDTGSQNNGLKGFDTQSYAGSVDLKSKLSSRTKNSKISGMTKENLQRYFKEKEKELEEDSKSRISLISKSHFGQ